VAVGIPSDLTGLLLFVILLLPGFAYNSVRARRRPDRQLTALQETVIIVTASLTALAVTGVVFAVIRELLPGVTPDVRAAVFSTHAYLQAHYVQAVWWAVAFLAAAIAGAAGVAAAQESRWLSRSRYLRGLAAPPDPSTQSGWWIAFRPGLDAGHQVHVGCTLDDGSYVDTVLLRRLYALIIIEHGTRRVHLAGITGQPGGAWTTQAARNFLMDLGQRATPVKFLIRDRAGQFTGSFGAVFTAEGIRILTSPPQAPRANAICGKDDRYPALGGPRPPADRQ
jgi:hypothetical protein